MAACELAARYRRGQRQQAILGGLGLPAAIVGLPKTIVGGVCWGLDGKHAPVGLPGARSMTFVGLGLVTVGIALLASMGRVDVPTVTVEETHELAERHNLRLREELRLPNRSGAPIATF